jgi:hypothetical protein
MNFQSWMMNKYKISKTVSSSAVVAPGLALCCAMAEKEREGVSPSGSDGGRQLTEWRNGVAALGSGGH